MDSMIKHNLPKGYIFLWVLVLFLCIIIFISHMVFYVGQGRWICTKYNTICNKCETKGTQIIKIYQQEIEMNWKTENPNICYCTQYETECVNEVWTRKR